MLLYRQSFYLSSQIDSELGHVTCFSQKDVSQHDFSALGFVLLESCLCCVSKPRLASLRMRDHGEAEEKHEEQGLAVSAVILAISVEGPDM